MAKTIITNVAQTENGFEVSYESGTVRRFASLPKTAQAWLEAHREAPEDVTEMETTTETEAPEETTEEAAETTTEETAGEASEDDFEVIQEEPVIIQMEEPVTSEAEEPVPVIIETETREARKPLSVPTVRPPKGEVVPMETEKEFTDMLYSLWLEIEVTFEVGFEYLAPVLLAMVAWLGSAARTTGKALVWTYTGARKALPVAKALLIQGYAVVAVAALCGAKIILVVIGTVKAGWQMRQELVNEWKEAA